MVRTFVHPYSFFPPLRWSKRVGHNRAQILYYIAENMELQKDSLAECLETMTGQPKGQGHEEVELALERLFFWAAYCDKYGGSVQVGMIWGHKFCLLPFLPSSSKK